MKKIKFQTGSIYTSQTIAKVMKETPKFSTLCQVLLNRHRNADWGDMENEDIESNDDALLSNGRLFSSYNLSDQFKNLISVNENKVWIITEWDRSATTILFPTEY